MSLVSVWHHVHSTHETMLGKGNQQCWWTWPWHFVHLSGSINIKHSLQQEELVVEEEIVYWDWDRLWLVDDCRQPDHKSWILLPPELALRVNTFHEVLLGFSIVCFDMLNVFIGKWLDCSTLNQLCDWVKVAIFVGRFLFEELAISVKVYLSAGQNNSAMLTWCVKSWE